MHKGRVGVTIELQGTCAWDVRAALSRSGVTDVTAGGSRKSLTISRHRRPRWRLQEADSCDRNVGREELTHTVVHVGP